ncbi:uncharacterized protein FA14DRAFT_64345 [Meira miltonrushii]|uniref:Uncharacterized protein n=1 Tax=Meira miltonrushii TaxID=1280837 RepID=A0A316VBN1_9BASI|nr:uncharacterized protein FA14DRAFT_64345 [Meira miltonrushii]PWN33663.1 hypothetical protein FA14DRAFT_64345 [Meira miltonrushii]
MSSNVFRTPLSSRTGFSGQASSSSSGSVRKSYEEAQNDLDGKVEEEGGARVYWYAPPSPSLQVQQAEHQRIMARAGAIQPMASQAFRDELLGPSKVQGVESNMRSRKVGRRSTRKSNGASTSTHSGSAENNSKGKNARDSGEIDQMLNDLDEHLTSKKVDLLTEDDADQCEVSAKDGAAVASQDTSQVETDNLQQVLIEGMDRAFSQDKSNYIIASTLPLISRNTKNWSRTASMPVHRSSQSDSQSIRNPILALPIQEDGGLLGKRSFPHSPEGVPQTASHGRKSSIDAMDISPCKSNNRPQRSSPNKRRAAESIDSAPLQERDANIQRSIAAVNLPQVKVRKGQFSRSVSEGVKQMNQIERLEVGTMTSVNNDAKVAEKCEGEPEEPVAAQSKSRSRASEAGMPLVTQDQSRSGAISPQASKVNTCAEKRSPTAHRQRTAPRCGLSRSAAPSSSRQNQVIGGKNSIFSGTASSANTGRRASVNAPFKQPMRRSPRKKEGENQKTQANTGSRSISRSTSGASDVITIDDSSDDEAERSTGKGRMATIKASPSAQEAATDKGKLTLHRSKEANESTAVGDVSFDTSLDDEALCNALDKIEASQKEQEEQAADRTNDSNKISQSAPAHPTSDDSFDNMIDDDVSAAILSRMDEEGW